MCKPTAIVAVELHISDQVSTNQRAARCILDQSEASIGGSSSAWPGDRGLSNPSPGAFPLPRASSEFDGDSGEFNIGRAIAYK